MRIVPALLLGALLLTGCSANRFGAWTALDSGSVAPGLAGDLLSGGWSGDYTSRLGRHPALRIELSDRSNWNLELGSLRDSLANRLLEGGHLSLILPREAVADADSLDPGNPAAKLTDSGADLLLRGWVGAFAEDGTAFYQISLELRDAQTDSLLASSLRFHQRNLVQKRGPGV